jgi:hypothetical protein
LKLSVPSEDKHLKGSTLPVALVAGDDVAMLALWIATKWVMEAV